MNKLEITTDCICDLELGDCIDCFAEQFETIEDQFNAWRDSVDRWHGDGLIRVISIYHYGSWVAPANVYHVVDFRDLWDRVLRESGEFTVVFDRDGDSLTANRYSHDAPTGVSLTFTVVNYNSICE